MKRGAICWVNLEPVVPPEMGKIRPALIISNSEQNLFLHSVVVVPISSRPAEIWPLRIRLDMPQGKTSFAILPGIRQVSKDRIQEIAGSIHAKDMERINNALSAYLSD